MSKIMNAQTIIIIDDLIRSVRNGLAPLSNVQNKHTGIILWSSDIIINAIIQQQTFLDRVSADLANNNLKSFAKDVRYSVQKPNSQVRQMELNTNHGLLYIGLLSLLPHITVRRGSLMESEYVLDWTQRNCWNIGRGERPADHYGVDIENYIVIKNDESDNEKRDNNERVSSFHAKIMYEDNLFYLQTEKGGRDYTRLRQGESEHTLRTGIKMPLHDGDFIKLGSINHYVLLLFKLS